MRGCAFACAGRWQYRFSMQVNIFANKFMQLSMVPPCLLTGVNFGNTAFFGSLHRAWERGDLGEFGYRLTDSGPDNDAVEAHALHVELVSRGALNRLVWARLMPKHSHNWADRVNSMVKEVIWPKDGIGGGCMAPWDMQAVVEKAVRSQRGDCEFAWQWCNVDWRARYEGHYHKEFAGYGSERLWVYEYDPNLPPTYVRVTFQKDLLSRDGSHEPAMLPCEPDEEVILST